MQGELGDVEGGLVDSDKELRQVELGEKEAGTVVELDFVLLVNEVENGGGA